MPAPAPGPDGFRQVIEQFRTAFPDFHVSIEDRPPEGDKVATPGVFTGTHRGEFMGVPPTGKQVRIKYMDAWRVENGKAVENWVQLDMLGLMQQLGAVPARVRPPHSVKADSGPALLDVSESHRGQQGGQHEYSPF